jgi:tetratricopeptide (TPR) repeat protein
MATSFLRRAFPAPAIFVAAALALALGAPLRALAQDHNYDNPREMTLLPEYCKYTMFFRDKVPGGGDPGQVQRWASVMGPTFNHMHHYCWALMATNRAQFIARNKQERGWALSASIPDFDYVIERAPADFSLLPEFLTKRGENLLRLERTGEGMADIERALSIKPKYWEAYVALSDYYRDRGDVAKAREWAEKGLAVSPGTMPLQRRVAQFDTAQGKRKSDSVTR